jgi:hypothetical protein
MPLCRSASADHLFRNPFRSLGVELVILLKLALLSSHAGLNACQHETGGRDNVHLEVAGGLKVSQNMTRIKEAESGYANPEKEARSASHAGQCGLAGMCGGCWANDVD